VKKGNTTIISQRPAASATTTAKLALENKITALVVKTPSSFWPSTIVLSLIKTLLKITKEEGSKYLRVRLKTPRTQVIGVILLIQKLL